MGLGMATADSVLYQLNHRRLAAEKGSRPSQRRNAACASRGSENAEGDGAGRTDLATPCRKVLESLAVHREGLTLFVDDPRIPMDNNTSERRARGAAVARKNFYGSGLWNGQLTAAAFSIFATLALWDSTPQVADMDFEHCAAAGARSPATSACSCPGT